jgi:hypothetical protein
LRLFGSIARAETSSRSPHRLDPAGEDSEGGYWILRSTDDGATWPTALYTGLRINRPYFAVARSRLPLVDGAGFRIEVVAVDAHRMRADRRDLYLAFKPGALETDTDHDGLSDLVEERLITDPANADTDRDGVADATDRLPHVPDGPVTAMGRIITAIAEIPPDIVMPADIRTAFVTGDRAEFGAPTISMRLIVVTPEERALAEQKFGPIYATSVSVVLTDATRGRAYVESSAPKVGGEYVAEKRGDDWVVRVIGRSRM